jgi:hypothetical protein
VAAVVEAAAVMASCGVDLVIVGGAALWLHGDLSDPLHDLDVVPSPDPANAEQLLACRAPLGAHASSWPTAGQLERCEVVTVATSFGPIDLLARRGREEYRTLRAGAVTVPVLGVLVPVASRGDVVRLKRRFGEPAGV